MYMNLRSHPKQQACSTRQPQYHIEALLDEDNFSQGEAVNNMLKIHVSTKMQPTSSPNRKNVWSVFFV